MDVKKKKSPTIVERGRTKPVATGYCYTTHKGKEKGGRADAARRREGEAAARQKKED